MKKFLTVLLALSVVFTYTIGTSFAAISTTTAADAQEAMEKAVNTYYAEKFAYNANGNLVSVNGATNYVDTNLTKAAVDAGVAQLISDYKEKIIIADAEGTDVTTAWTTDLGTNAENLFTVLVGDNGEKEYAAADGVIYTKAVTDVKDAATAYMDSVNTELYAEADAAKIVAAKNVLSNALTAAKNSKDGLNTLLTAVGTFKTEVAKYTPVANQEAELAKYKNAALNKISALATSFEPKEAERLDKVDTSKFTVSQMAEHNAKVANLSANVAAVVDLFTAKVNAETLDNGLDTAKSNIDTILTKAETALTNSGVNAEFYNVVNQISDSAVLVTYAETYATSLKNLYDQSTGLAVYNAATVDKVLEATIAKIKALTITSYADVKSALDATPKATDEVTALEKYKAQAVSVITTDGAGVTDKESVSGTSLFALKGKFAKTNWDADNQSAIDKIQKDYTLKIKAAASKEDVVALVKEATAAMEDVALRTAEARTVKTSVTAVLKTLSYATADTGKGGTIENYAKSKNSGKQYSDDILAGAMKQAVNVLYDAVLAEKNTNLTNAQITVILQNNYSAALAKIDAMLTTTELKASAESVIAMIKALPATVTIADKAQYLAAEQAYEDYLELAGAKAANITNRALLDAYMTRLIALERAAVEAQIRALPSAATLADKDAVEAARTAVDAYDDAYSKYVSGDYDYDYAAVTNIAKLTTAEVQVSNAKLVDAAKKIAALPAVVTTANTAEVEAARAAYDSLTDIEKSQFSKALLEKLTAAEKQIKEAKIKATESLKLSVSTKLYTKSNKIRVNWKVKDGDASYIDGYQVYKSTKAQTNYKFMGKTKKNYMDNKKNLKKGTRYYYKVRAYIDVDGERYFSDWSNKGNRIYK